MTTPVPIKELLESWQVQDEIIEKFTENGIETTHFKDLSDELLKELCPKISTRLYIKKKISELLTAQSTTSTVSSMPSCAVGEVESDLDDDFVLQMLTYRPAFPEFDLRTLLSTSPTGNSILTYYETHNSLTSKHRNTLTDIIIRRIFTRLINQHRSAGSSSIHVLMGDNIVLKEDLHLFKSLCLSRINHEEYNILTAKIIALFPTENAGTYFVPSVKKRDSICGKPVFAKGKLVDKVRNTLYKSGERKRTLPEKENVDHNPKKSKNLQQLQDMHKDDVVWLKNNTEPWEDVIKKWKSTFELRQLIDYDTVAAFIEYWPILNDIRSDVLIHLDFDQLHPAKTNHFHIKWVEFMDKIKNKKSELNEETAALAECIKELADEDQKLPAEVQLLCHLVPPKGRLNRRQKFSIAECTESIFINVKTPGDIQKKVDEVAAIASIRCQTVQPYIIHCTSQEKNDGGTFYLIVDKVRYVYKSAYKAFDTLFKCYHTFHATYPKAGYHLYLLIQKCVYNIDTKYDVVPPYITDVISAVKC